MPNWCNNTITIKGSTDSIRELWETAQTADNGQFGLLNAIMPMPEELKDTVADGSEGPNWYNWRVANWGTKWEIDDTGLEFVDHGDGTASIQGWFDSAWAPPIGVYEQFAQDFDSCYLEAFYHEPGMCFVGCWDSEGGDDYYEYTDGSEIPNYLDEHFGIREDMAMWEEENSDTVELEKS